jgi:hypothetical protein
VESAQSKVPWERLKKTNLEIERQNQQVPLHLSNIVSKYFETRDSVLEL